MTRLLLDSCLQILVRASFAQFYSSSAYHDVRDRGMGGDKEVFWNPIDVQRVSNPFISYGVLT